MPNPTQKPYNPNDDGQVVLDFYYLRGLAHMFDIRKTLVVPSPYGLGHAPRVVEKEIPNASSASRTTD